MDPSIIHTSYQISVIIFFLKENDEKKNVDIKASVDFFFVRPIAVRCGFFSLHIDYILKSDRDCLNLFVERFSLLIIIVVS